MKNEIEVIEKKANSKILQCLCEHKAQDEFYGKGMRVHNRTEQIKSREEQYWRCTVCSREKKA
jgi:hypothetical protein